MLVHATRINTKNPDINGFDIDYDRIQGASLVEVDGRLFVIYMGLGGYILMDEQENQYYIKLIIDK